MAPILETRKLTHIYSPGTPFQRVALNEVDFAVGAGEYVGIIGHTGSGKSTLIQHLNGLLKPSGGEVLFQGQNIWHNTKYIRETRFRVGLVFQYPEYQLFEETVYKDIAFGPTNMGLYEDEIHRRVLQSAEFVGLTQKILEKSPFELSGGQKRRVAIAGVIAMEPSVLILDEPTAGLDPAGAQGILENIQAYKEAHNATVILVSHSMEDVAKLVQRLVVFQGGEIPLQGLPHQVFGYGEQLEKMGLGVPQITRVFHRLRGMGVPIDPSIFTVEQGRDAILAYLKNRNQGQGEDGTWH